MALKALLLRKKIDDAKKSLELLRQKDAEFETRETELTESIAEVTEATTEEERNALDEMVASFDADKTAHEDSKKSLEDEIAGLENDLAAEEAAQRTDPPAEPQEEHKKEERKEVKPIMNTRAAAIFGKMSLQERTAFFDREDVKSYLTEVRTAIKEKRALNNVGLTIPTVMLGLLRQNIEDFSKLYKHVTVRAINGEGRQLIMGEIPEAVWTDCCANLNELTLSFYDLEVDCYMVAGYFAICNANLEDSDIDLAAELLTALGQSIGLALDKAILYGRNATTTQKMPQGIVSRLVQTAQPAGYPATARPWVDLHETNVLTIASTVTGVDFFKALAIDSGAAKGAYARGEKVWVMNETTYTKVVAEAMAIDAGGAIVSGVNGTMPVIGGIIEVLNFLPDNVIIGGYFELYTLAERRGAQFATSEHVRFLANQTVMKGTARYDGAPAIAEAFVAVGIGAAPTAAMTFASDTANSGT